MQARWNSQGDQALGRRLFGPTRTSGYLTHGRARRASADPGSKSPGCQTIVATPLGGSARLVPQPAADGIAPRCGSVLEHQLIQGHQSGIAELCKVRREYPVVVGYELFHVGLEARNQ